MASEVLYTKVSPKERENFISEASDTVCSALLVPPGDSVTYAEVNIKRRSDRRDSTPQIACSVTCLENSPYCYVVFALLFCATILLLTVILMAAKCYSR